MKRIWIMPRAGMADTVLVEEQKYNVIIIRDPNEHEPPAGEDYARRLFRAELTMATKRGIEFSKSHTILEFHDFWEPSPGRTLATRADIEKAMAFADGVGVEDLIVACAAGISRSSATAYIIAREHMEVEDAPKVVSKQFHRPNPWILNIGEEITGKPLKKELLDSGFTYLTKYTS